MRRPRIAVETTSVEAMIAVTLNSKLLCWLPEPLLAAHSANGTVRRIEVPELTVERQFQLFRRATGLLPEAAREFVLHFPLVGERTSP
jgi:DNA-binding transcriptional LysR family regulator